MRYIAGDEMIEQRSRARISHVHDVRRTWSPRSEPRTEGPLLGAGAGSQSPFLTCWP